MSEQAQALNAIRERLRTMDTTKRVADRAGWAPTALAYYVEDVTTLLGLLEAGVIREGRIPGYNITYAEMDRACEFLRDHGCTGGMRFDEAVAALVPAVSPVEPTPTTPHTREGLTHD